MSTSCETPCIWHVKEACFARSDRPSTFLLALVHVKPFFFFNRHCNPCGFWPAQPSLSILSRKVFTECRCRQHVKPPTWRTGDLERSISRHKVSPASETTRANPSSGMWNYVRKIAENFAENGDFHVTFGFFYMP